METNNEKLNAIQAKLRKLQKMYEGAKAINSEGEAAAAAAALCTEVRIRDWFS